MLCENNKSVYMMYTAWSRKGTDMFCGRYVYRFLHSWKDDLFVITDVRILHIYCKKYKIYILLLFQGSLFKFSVFVHSHKNLLQPHFTIQDPFQTIRHLLHSYFIEIIQKVYIR